MKTIRAIVSGRVQGVWYRAHTRDKAVELGVAGFVRNLPDGTVEIVAQADPVPVQALMDWARTGPPMAVVHGLQVEELTGNEIYDTFDVAY